MFSSRVPTELTPNRWARSVATLRARGTPYIDLTETNPTRAGFTLAPEHLRALAAPAAAHYDPHPLGLATARRAVADEYRRHGVAVDPEHIVLTSSTSEAYSLLFKLLCDAGDGVLVPQPSYPLFEHLTRLDGVVPLPYRLEYEGAWHLDLDSLEAAADGPRPRAVLLVSPNNPTGSIVTAHERDALLERCAARGLALVVDEVFLDYPLAPRAEAAATFVRDSPVLTFTLGGLSKSAGLPQLKLGWIHVGGPEPFCRDALARLEVIADAYLSVGTPVQLAAPALLRAGARLRSGILDRIRINAAAARTLVRDVPACEVLNTEAGWSAVIRVPALVPDEELALTLLERDAVAVHPGYFFDFAKEGFLSISLLPPTAAFTEGLRRVFARAVAPMTGDGGADGHGSRADSGIHGLPADAPGGGR